MIQTRRVLALNDRYIMRTHPKILVVDSSNHVRERLVGLAGEFPNVLIIGWADNGSTALESFRSYRPDAVLLSIELPDRSGLRVLEQMKRERPDCVVVVLVDSVFPEFRQRCAELGTEHFFEKATEFEAALEVLARLPGRNGVRRVPESQEKKPA